jgi:hypothetical protein
MPSQPVLSLWGMSSSQNIRNIPESYRDVGEFLRRTATPWSNHSPDPGTRSTIILIYVHEVRKGQCALPLAFL